MTPLRPASALRALVVLAMAGSTAALSACAHGGPTPPAKAEAAVLTPLDQYPLKASEAPIELALAAHPAGLSPNQRAKLADLAQRWRDGGGSGPVLVRSPEGAGPAPAMARQAAETLRASGVPQAAIRLAGYPEPRPDAPVVVSFIGYTAEVADCANQWGNLMSTRENTVTGHFGCTVHANLAAQIADPHDIVAPHPLDPADGMRRAEVLSNYRGGKKTSSERDSQAQGTLSSVAQ